MPAIRNLANKSRVYGTSETGSWGQLPVLKSEIVRGFPAPNWKKKLSEKNVFRNVLEVSIQNLYNINLLSFLKLKV